jgi:hypothetical protein
MEEEGRTKLNWISLSSISNQRSIKEKNVKFTGRSILFLDSVHLHSMEKKWHSQAQLSLLFFDIEHVHPTKNNNIKRIGY